MAKQQAVWGIDIGQCALKAMRCVLGEDGQIIAEAFDYIPYPKSLSQPDAQPEEIVRESLQQFLSRNRVRGDKVAMSVSGQSGLARFFRPPGADPKLLPSLVKYEAKQQIPFQIDEVVWDWQQIGGYVSDGQLSEAEVGLFAMKRETVYRSMQPFIDAGVEVDFVQLSPIATFNTICHDMLGDIPNPEEIDPENPPPYHLVISIGTDSTDVVVTNGNRLWLRNIALGGNHFTKQLSREMKLTHAKAEQLKRNARKAENPKEIFKAMRPVFSDMGDELARSLNFFRSIDRNAEFEKVMLMGNASLLPGLRQYLETQIDLKIDRFEGFSKLEGAEVLGQKSFTAHIRSFAPCYGLCIQALGESRLTTNLLPQEFIVEKIVRAKKPWVLSAVSLVMLGVAVAHALGANYAFRTSDEFQDSKGENWASVKKDAESVKRKSDGFLGDDEDLKRKLMAYNDLLNTDLVGPTPENTKVLQLYTVISQMVPNDPKAKGKVQIDDKDYPHHQREDVYVDQFASVFYEDGKEWFTEANQKKFTKHYFELKRKARPGELNPLEGVEVDLKDVNVSQEAKEAAEKAAAASGSMDANAGDFGNNEKSDNLFDGKSVWVVHIKGHHFANGIERINAKMPTQADFVRQHFVKNFFDKEIDFKGEKYYASDFGIKYPTIVKSETEEFDIPGAVKSTGTVGAPAVGGGGGTTKDDQEGSGDKAAAARQAEIKKTDFVIEFLWKPISVNQVVENRNKRVKREEAARKALEEAQKGAAKDSGDSGQNPGS